MSPRTFRSKPLDLAVDTISERDVERIVAWLRQYPRLTMASETRRFEQAWSRWLGVKYSVFCNSGSSANLLMYAALDAAGRLRTRKVVVPATGWVTTVAPAIQLGFQPIMCESDPLTFGLSVPHLERILKRDKPEAVVLVHVLGVPNDMGPLLRLQKRYGFQLIEDCCAAHGARHRGRLVGTFGQMAAFSFYYGHHMSTIEGGVVSTNDRELYYRLVMLRSHGWCKELPPPEYRRLMRKYHIDDFHSPFTFVIPGFNLRSTDLNAFIGRIQLARLNANIRHRIRNHRLYQRLLDGRLEFARGAPGDVISSISFCALAQSTDHRRRIVRALEAHEVDTRIFTAGNLGRHPFWTERYGLFSAPVADALYARGFFLPNNPAITPPQIRRICQLVLQQA